MDHQEKLRNSKATKPEAVRFAVVQYDICDAGARPLPLRQIADDPGWV
jgi:hypothetical protein